jgi:hypothetical protein
VTPLAPLSAVNTGGREVSIWKQLVLNLFGEKNFPTTNGLGLKC